MSATITLRPRARSLNSTLRFFPTDSWLLLPDTGDGLTLGLDAAASYHYFPVLQFPSVLPATATLTAATLRLLAGTTDADSSHAFSVMGLDYWNAASVTDVHSAPVLAQTTGTIGAWTAGAWASYDVLSVMQAILAAGNYRRNGLCTLKVSSDTEPRVLAGFGTAPRSAATLELAFDALGAGTDPYTTLINAVWDVLIASPWVAELVPPGNRVDWAGTARVPVKDAAITADYPELRVHVASVDSHLRHTSTSSTEVVTLTVEVATGDQRQHKWLLPLRWAVWRAMSDAFTALRGCEWEGEPFVVELTPRATQAAIDQATVNRSIRGWSAVWAADVLVQYSTAAL